MRTSLKALAILSGLAGLLAGCSGSGFQREGYDIPPMPSLHLNARKLQIVNNWEMPVGEPNIGRFQRIAPAEHIIDWAAEVLVPAGGSGEVVLEISRAELTMERLAIASGVKDLLVDQQESRIRFDVDAELEWIQPVGSRSARLMLTATYSVTVPETASPRDIDDAISEAVDIAISHLDQDARRELNKIDKLVLP